MEDGGLEVESVEQKSELVFQGIQGSPRAGGLLARAQGICSLESLRNLADDQVEHVHRNMEIGGQDAGLAAFQKPELVYQAIQGSPLFGLPAGVERESFQSGSRQEPPDVPLEHVHFKLGSRSYFASGCSSRTTQW